MRLTTGGLPEVSWSSSDTTVATLVRAADILGSSLPSGRYYFAVAVHAEGNRVMLSAGDAQLSR